VISSFACSDTRRIFDREYVRRFSRDVQIIAFRKLVLVDNVTNLNDLRFPPGNRLEKLKGNRAGQFSIRVNDQFRICFRWSNGNASDVELVDYH
jgi:toxin HigB-1